MIYEIGIHLLNFLTFINSHSEMIEPSPRRSQYQKNIKEELKDYDLESPLITNTDHLCKYKKRDPPQGSYFPGSSINTKILIDDKHFGGHCQFSISTDGKNFVTLKTIFNDCIMNRNTYQVTIPQDILPGLYVYAWSWVNREGNAEFYMDCADIEIKGNGNRPVTGKKMVVVNLSRFSNIKMSDWKNRDNFHKELYDNSPVITLGTPLKPNKR